MGGIFLIVGMLDCCFVVLFCVVCLLSGVVGCRCVCISSKDTKLYCWLYVISSLFVDPEGYQRRLASSAMPRSLARRAQQAA